MRSAGVSPHPARIFAPLDARDPPPPGEGGLRREPLSQRACRARCYDATIGAFMIDVRPIAVRLTLSAMWAVGLATLAQAQTYPDKPIKLVVPFPAGGATDTTARLVAQSLQSGLGQTVVVENQGGAGGTIGSRQVAHAAGDGYTLLMVAVGNTFGSQPVLYN